MAPLSMGFCRQKFWSGLPFPSPENFPDPGIETLCPTEGGSLPFESPGKPLAGVMEILKKKKKKNLCYFISVLCFFLSERDMSHGSSLYFRPAVIMAGGKYQKHWNEQTVGFEALFKMVCDIYAYISFGQSKSR